MTPEPGRLDRIEGVLLASACGDALGVPYEFGSAPLGPAAVPQMIGGGLGPYAPGEWSDDTQMTVVVARVAAARGLRDREALDEVVEGWLGWLRDGASDVGTQTRQVLGAVALEPAAEQEPEGRASPLADRARGAAAELHRRTGRSAGNGSLMRTAPVALAFLDDPASLTVQARTISRLTHRDDLAGDACVLWCHAIRRAVLDGAMPDLAELVDVLSPGSRGQWARWIADAARRPPSHFTPNGYVVTALQAAWSSIVHPMGDSSPVEASLAAAVHAGDDTDTVAAIAGALLGAAHGASSLPGAWVELVHGWPGLRADDLRVLARAVSDRGSELAEEHRVPDELVEVAEHLVARGLGEGYDFWVAGRPVVGGLSSEYIGLRRLDDGTYRVWYLGDWGVERTLVETADWAEARRRFVDAAVTQARARHRSRRILDDPEPRRRWWQRR